MKPLLPITDLRARLLLAALLVFVPLLSWTAYTQWHGYQRLVTALRADAQRVVQNLVREHEINLEALRAILIGIGEVPVATETDRAACVQRLEAIRAQYSVFANLAIARPDGDVVCSAITPAGKINFADRSWFQYIMASKRMSAPEYVIGRISGKPTAVIGNPILGVDAAVRQIPVATLDLDTFVQRLRATQLPDQSMVLLLDKSGTVLVRAPGDPAWLGRSVVGTELESILKVRGAQEFEQLGLDGVARLYSVQTLGAADAPAATLAVGVPAAAIFAPARESFNRAIFILSALFLLVIVVAIATERALIRPLRQLSRAARQFGAGEPDVALPLRAVGETGELAREFERMMVTLKQRERLLSESQRQLTSLIANVPGVVYRCRNDPNWTTEFISEGVLQLFSYPAADYMEHRREIGQSIHPDDQGRVWDEIQAALREHRRYELSYRIICASGETKWLWEQGAGVFDASGTLLALEGFGIDITARKQAEATLQQSEQRLRDLIDGLGPYMFVGLMTPDGILVEANRPALAAAGLLPADVIGKHFDETYWWSYAIEVKQQLRAAIERAVRGEPSRYDVTVRVGENQFIDIDFSLQPLRDREGKVAFLVPSAVVITERKQAEAALRAQHIELENLYATTPVGLALIDRNLRFLRINERLAAINGKPVAAHFGQTIAEVLPELADVLVPIYRRVLDTGEPVLNVEIHGETPAEPGVPRDWLASYHPLRAADGSVSGISIAFMEITEQKQAAAALHESDARFRTAITAMAEGVVVQGPNNVNLTCNDAAERILGLTHEQMMGRSSFDPRWRVVHEDGSPFPADAFPSVVTMRTGTPQRNVLLGVHKPDGTLSWISVNTQPLINPGEALPNGVVATFHDITDRKQAEAERLRLQQQLQQAQKMEALGQLTGGIAHDFNNILASIIGYSDLALERFEIDRPAVVADYLRQVKLAGERARDLIANMLAFSRGRAGVEVAPLNAAVLVKEALKLLGAAIPSSIHIDVRVEPGLPRVMFNPVALHQSLLNLCINARDALHGQGKIEITLARAPAVAAVCDSCHQPISGDFVALTVRDNGEGIASDVVSRIFDPFFTTKAVGKGTGLGLAMVHGVVHECGGHIRVQSQPGQGTAVTLWLCVADEAALAADTAKALAPPGRGERVLVVDDEKPLAQLLGEMLTARGYRPRVYTDSRAALAAFEAAPDNFDVAVIDQTMPGMTGAELSVALLARRPDLPIVMCTGYSEQLDEAGARKLGIRRYLLKPVASEALLTALTAELHPTA